MSTGVTVSIEAAGLDAALLSLGKIAAFDPATLMEEIAALGESQTRRRILEEKTAPDGTPWPKNREGTPTLHRSGQHLLASIAFSADAGEARWGASWEFAHIHQDGATIKPKHAKPLSFMSGGVRRIARKVTIPARPFVGLSADNRSEMAELVSDHFGRLAR